MDAALSALPAVLPVLDYSTIKNELFPVISNVFTHTNSLAIKIRAVSIKHKVPRFNALADFKTSLKPSTHYVEALNREMILVTGLTE